MAQNVFLYLSVPHKAAYSTVACKHVLHVLQTLPSEFLCNHKNLYCQTKNCLIIRQPSSPDQDFWHKQLLRLKLQARTMKNLRLQYLVILKIIYMYLCSSDT